MAVVAATRMKVGRWRDLPRFLLGTMLAAVQAWRTPGFQRGVLRIEPSGAFWTLTSWESGGAMSGFRDSGVHERLVPRLAGWASEAVFGVWSSADASLPPWDEVSKRVAAQPHVPPLDRPDARHGDPARMGARRLGLDLPIPPRGGRSHAA